MTSKLSEKDNNESKKIKKELELIKLIEDIKFDNKAVITSIELQTYLMQNYSELKNSSNDCKKKIIYQILKLIDTKNTGFISIIDLIKFILKYFQYKSTKLAYIHIKAQIKKQKISAIKYFQDNYTNYSSYAILKHKQMIEFINSKFNVPKTVVKKMIDDYYITYNTRTVYLYDFVSLFDDINIDSKKGYDLSLLEDSTKYMDIETFEQDVTSKVLSINNINYKLNDDYNIDYIYNNFDENFNTMIGLSGVNFKEEKDDIYYDFKEFNNKVIKPLNLKFNLGLIIFNILKKNNNNKEEVVSINNVKTFFKSFLQKDIKINKTDEIIKTLEQKGPSIKMAFEDVPFHSSGIITVIELINCLSIYYPNANKNMLSTLIKEIDINSNGIISYKQLFNFFYYNYNKDKYSYNLQLKYILSQLIQQHKINDKAEDYFNSTNLIEMGILDINEIDKDKHNIIFNKLFDNNTIFSNMFYEEILVKQNKQKYYSIPLFCEDLNCLLYQDI